MAPRAAPRTSTATRSTTRTRRGPGNKTAIILGPAVSGVNPAPTPPAAPAGRRPPIRVRVSTFRRRPAPTRSRRGVPGSRSSPEKLLDQHRRQGRDHDCPDRTSSTLVTRVTTAVYARKKSSGSSVRARRRNSLGDHVFTYNTTPVRKHRHAADLSAARRRRPQSAVHVRTLGTSGNLVTTAPASRASCRTKYLVPADQRRASPGAGETDSSSRGSARIRGHERRRSPRLPTI